MKGISFRFLIAVLSFAFLISTVTAGDPVNAVERVDPGTITFQDCVNLKAVGDGNYDEIIAADGLSFAERFNGQSLTYSDNFDVLSGSPANPLSLQVGSPGQNLAIAYDDMLEPLGPLGFPNSNAYGEGSVAVLFPSPQRAFKFDVWGSSNNGPMTVKFFRSDGGLLGTFTAGATDETYAFKTSSGNPEIAGFSIENCDRGGLGFWNFCYSQKPVNTPEFPSTLIPLALIIGILGIVLLVQRTREQ